MGNLLKFLKAYAGAVVAIASVYWLCRFVIVVADVYS